MVQCDIVLVHVALLAFYRIGVVLSSFFRQSWGDEVSSSGVNAKHVACDDAGEGGGEHHARLRLLVGGSHGGAETRAKN
jgi:hypothetical protein